MYNVMVVAQIGEALRWKVKNFMVFEQSTIVSLKIHKDYCYGASDYVGQNNELENQK